MPSSRSSCEDSLFSVRGTANIGGSCVDGVFGRTRATEAFLWLFLIVACIPSNLYAKEASDTATEHMVAIGDVHGAFDDFCLILRRAGLTDEQNHWTGGRATLIQTGDLIDRGPKGRETMDLVMKLEKEAGTAGGQVVPLLGNHEVMNVLGDLRYVPPQSYASFVNNDSGKSRETAYQQYVAWYESHAKTLPALKQPVFAATKEEWMAKHPPGFLEYREAFGPDRSYGQWIRQHATVAKLGGVVFVHGGISPSMISWSLDQINSQVRKELAEFEKAKQDLVARKVILPFFTLQEILVAAQGELLAERAAGKPPDAAYHNLLQRVLAVNSWTCMSDDGPLWFRGYDQWSEEEGTSQVQKVLAAYDAAHIVVAHTVQKVTHIRSRFGGRAFLIDTGMLSSYWPGGTASALEISAGKFTALYLDSQEVVFDSKARASGKVN